METKQKNILLAVCTRSWIHYSKSDEFKATLKQIQTFGLYKIKFLIVENSGESNFEIDDELKKYVNVICETRVGIPHARNAAVRYAISNNFYDLIFLDDDCMPSKKWLEEIVSDFYESGSDVMQGGWQFIYSSNYSKIFPILDNSNFHKGQVLETASTRNVIFNLKKVKKLSLQFDVNLSEIGGSDTLFFSRLHGAEANLVATNRALVYEKIELERARFSWHFKRRIRTSQSWLMRNYLLGEPLAKSNFFYILSVITFSLQIISIIFLAIPALLTIKHKRKFFEVLYYFAFPLAFVLFKLNIYYKEYK